MAWLAMQGRPGQLQPPPPDWDFAMSIRAWNMLGGLDWSGIEKVASLLGIPDTESLILDLITIRDNLT